MSDFRVKIDYTNWRGERRERIIIPHQIMFGISNYHPEPQWMLDAKDVEKGEVRRFAMRDIHKWEELPEA